jgi:excisionase family DNA binding protein
MSHVSPSTLARRIGVHPRTIVRWIKSGEIRAVKFGAVWRIPEDEAQRLVENGLYRCTDSQNAEKDDTR